MLQALSYPPTIKEQFMFEFINTEKYMIFTNGYNIMHLVESNDGYQVSSGQPMCLFLDDKQSLINMFFESYIETQPKLINGSEELINKTQTLYPIYTIRPVIWSIGYSLEGANEIQSLIATTDFVRVTPIKHPNRDEYAIPFIQTVFDAIPDDLPAKQVLLQRAMYKIVNGQRKNNMQMIEDGWF
jgi:hypothetical protein